MRSRERWIAILILALVGAVALMALLVAAGVPNLLALLISVVSVVSISERTSYVRRYRARRRAPVTRHAPRASGGDTAASERQATATALRRLPGRRVPPLRLLSVAMTTLIAAIGCGDGAPTASDAGASPIVDSKTIDGQLERACAELGATERMPVLCPSWLPRARPGSMRYAGYKLSHEDFETGRCVYLTQMGYAGRGEGRSVPFHVLFGGRCGGFPMATSSGRWPARELDEDLRLTTEYGSPPDERLIRPRVAARVTVNGQPALVLRVRHAPVGGIHGGHYAIVWNTQGAGYVLSFHYYRGDSDFEQVERALPPRRSDVHALVRAAQSMTAAQGRESGEPEGAAARPSGPRLLCT